MVICGRSRHGKDTFHEFYLIVLNFIYEAIPFIAFALVIGLLWFLGIAIFVMTSLSFA
jgi:hypothetical protein